MKRYTRLALAISTFLAIASCNSAPSISSPEHVEWAVESMAEFNVELTEETTPTLKLFMAKATGKAGCNNFNGSFSMQGEGIKFPTPTFAVTKKMCPPEVMEIEEHYLGLLGRVQSWKITDNNKLLFLDDLGNELLTLSFVRELESTETL